MALDEPKDSDDVFDIDGFTYIVDKTFMEQAKPVKIDFIGASSYGDATQSTGKIKITKELSTNVLE